MREYTPDEANALVPRIRPLLVALRAAFHELSFAREQVADALAMHDETEAARWRTRAEPHAARVDALVSELVAMGVEVKDPTLGLVDLRGRRADGSVAYLCYRDDEDAIRFWHPLDTGFAGRRPLGEW